MGLPTSVQGFFAFALVYIALAVQGGPLPEPSAVQTSVRKKLEGKLLKVGVL